MILSMTADGPTSKWRISSNGPRSGSSGRPRPPDRADRRSHPVQRPRGQALRSGSPRPADRGTPGAPRLPRRTDLPSVPLKSGDQSGNQGIYGFSVNLINQNSFLYGNVFTDQASFEAGGPGGDCRDPRTNPIEPEEARNIEQGRRMDSGSSVLARFTPEVLRSVAEDSVPEFYRIYERAPDGSERELGWQQVSTSRRSRRWRSAGHGSARDRTNLGTLVVVTGEVVSEYPEKSITIDVERRHWLALDRSRERWSMALTPGRWSAAKPTGGDQRRQTSGRPASEPPCNRAVDDHHHRQRREARDPRRPRGPPPALRGRTLRHRAPDQGLGDGGVQRGLVRPPPFRGPRQRDPQAKGPLSARPGDRWMGPDHPRPRWPFVQEFDARGRRIVPGRHSSGTGEEFELILERIDPTRLQIYAEKGLPTR